jgi:5-methylcytosine-specific restriction enzyme A
MPPKDDFHLLDPAHTDPARLKREREKARELRKTAWWKQRIAPGLCHYCERKFKPSQLTMDHVLPLARGGTSAKTNLVPACAECNRDKKLATPVDDLFAKIEAERIGLGSGNEAKERSGEVSEDDFEDSSEESSG